MRVSGLRGILTLVPARESIGSHVFGARSVGQGEVESAEQESPTRMLGTQPLRLPDVSEIFVVSPYEHRMLGPLQPVYPLPQGGDHGQKFPVSHVIITFSRFKDTKASSALGVQENGMVVDVRAESGAAT